MDGDLGVIEFVVQDCPLPHGNRCSYSGEPAIHIFPVALCMHPSWFFYSEFACLTCSQVSGVPPLEVCYYPVACSYYLTDRGGAQRSAEQKWGQDAAWQTYKRSVATHTPLALLNGIFQESSCILAIFVGVTRCHMTTI